MLCEISRETVTVDSVYLKIGKFYIAEQNVEL